MNHRSKATQAQQALTRAIISQSTMNYAPIIAGFMAKGIPADQITPRENVFTFQAWKAKGRFVRRGEKGVKVCTWVPMIKRTLDAKTGETTLTATKYPQTTTVFHVSQTEEMAG